MHTIKSGIRIAAWKSSENTQYRSPCELEDPAATGFEISYPGAPFPSSTIDVAVGADGRDQALYRAQEIARAMERVFGAGKNAAKSELQSWLARRE